jgi:spore coat polysaccharide biosynthesis protein SpsF
MRVVAVVQARMASTRLPGKVLLPLSDKPLLERMLERVRSAALLDDLVVATTTMAADEPIVALCRRIGVSVVAGHPTDLLDRHYRVGTRYRADAVVKIPSDCPLIDPRIIDLVIRRFRRLAREEGAQFVSNLHPATWPDGNDVEVVSMAALETAWREATRGFEREHTTPFIWDQPERFRLANVEWETARDLSMSHRFTIDYSDDYRFIRRVYDELYLAGGRPFSLESILALLEVKPELARINAHLAGVNWYRHHLEDLRTVGPHETVLHETA